MFTNIEVSRAVIKKSNEYKYQLIWNSTNEHYTFPTYRIISENQYYGIGKMLNKPHGLKSNIIEIITLLLKKDYYRWNTIAKKYIESIVAEVIPILVQAGIILVGEKNLRPAKGEKWVRIEVAIDPRAIDEARNLFGEQDAFEQWRIKLNEEVKELLFPISSYQLPIISKIDLCIQEGLEKLNTPTIRNAFPAQLTSRRKFRSILLMLIYVRDLVEKEEVMPLYKNIRVYFCTTLLFEKRL